MHTRTLFHLPVVSCITALLCLLTLTTTSFARQPSASFGMQPTRLIPSANISAVEQTLPTTGDPATIYYPDLAPRLRGSYGTYPVVIMMQGARVLRKYYSQYARELARYGFVVVVPDHTSSILGQLGFTEFTVITDSLTRLELETSNPDSPLYGIVDTTKAALSGHSFGTAAALFAIGDICIFPFCPPDSGFVLPSAVQAAAVLAGNAGTLDIDSTGIPVAIIVGDIDTGRDDGARTYEILEPPRAFIELRDANHYGLNDIDQPPEASVREGEASQITPQSISAARFGQWAGIFLRAHLYGDQRAWRRIYVSGGDANATITSVAD